VGVLENALRASGGLDLWRLTRRFIVHMSITGDLCSTKCSNAKLKELVVEGSTHVQELEMTGFARADITFHFDREGLLRRLDYRAPHATHAPITQVYSGHQRFSGILVPTLCRLSAIGPNSGPVGKPALLDVEIFDVNFA